MRTALAIVLLSPLIVGCVATMNVKGTTDGKGFADVAGVPFLSRRVQKLQRTEYEQRWVDVTLQVQLAKVQASCRDTSKTTTIVMRDDRSGRYLADSKLRATLAAVRAKSAISEPASETDGKALVESILTAFKDAAELSDEVRFKPDATKHEVWVASNSMIDTVVIDSARYFLNGKQPWFGTSTLDFALLPDGTLSSAKSSVESKAGDVVTGVLNSALGALPVKELFQKRWGLDAKDTAAVAADSSDKIKKPLTIKRTTSSCTNPAPRFTVTLDLKSSPGRTVWVFTQPADAGKKSVPFDVATGQFVRREEVATEPAAPAEKSDAPKIGFEGSVTLPKKP